MKRILNVFLALGVCLTPVTVTLMAQPSWGQTQNSQIEEVDQLIEQAVQQTRQRQPQEAIQTFQQALVIARKLQVRKFEATALLGLGLNYHDIGQPQQALDYYNQALPIFKAVDNAGGEAATLSNIGEVYRTIGQPQKALDYYNQALPILRKVRDPRGEATTLNNIGEVYRAIGQPQKALDYYKQALPIRREVRDPRGEAVTLNNIGMVYDSIGQPQKALDYYKQALPIRREVRDPRGEATTLNNIGAVYDSIGQPQKALDYYNQALSVLRAVGNVEGEAEAATLNNIGLVYQTIGQPQKALDYYNQALSIRRKVGDLGGEAVTLSNIGKVYRNTNRPTEAIANWEQSIKITLKMRGGLHRDNKEQTRQKFLQTNYGSAIALVDFLIDQKQYDKAYEWLNLATTADLADYTRLINAKVASPQAQQAIDEWNQKNQQLEFLRQQLQNNFSEALSQQIRELEAQVNQQAEDISRRFPDVAELFETTVTDIEKLKSSIPTGTVVVQPVLLTNATNVTETVAIFVLTKDHLSVVKIQINPTEFDGLLTQYLKQLQDESDSNYTETGGKLYDFLIRPVEDKIQAFSPKQLSIIATDKLRYLPFETLYDSKADQFLIQKYPVNYLTRLSTRSLQQTVERKASVLALGNPVPVKPYALDGAEAEVNHITQTLPGSQPYIRDRATLDAFKTQSPRFPFLHLATHGCFQPEGCCLPESTDCRKPEKPDLQPNTILFANQQFFNIADAALLGLNNTELLTLSACQTAKETNSNGEGISGVAYIFERAGAKAVMASLWSTNDEATKQLMIQFYENLKQGMNKGEALRQAKLTQIHDHRHPFYWSPFILIGDAR